MSVLLLVLEVQVLEEHASLSVSPLGGELRSEVSRREQPVSKSSAALECFPKKKKSKRRRARKVEEEEDFTTTNLFLFFYFFCHWDTIIKKKD